MEMSNKSSPTVAISSVNHSPFGCDTSSNGEKDQVQHNLNRKEMKNLHLNQNSKKTYEFVCEHLHKLH